MALPFLSLRGSGPILAGDQKAAGIGAPVLLTEPSHPELTHCAHLPGGASQASGTLDRPCQTLGTSNTGPQRTVAHPQNYLSFSIHDTIIVIVTEVKFIDHTFTILEYTIQGFSTHYDFNHHFHLVLEHSCHSRKTLHTP